jgi:hypothetical protein
LAARPLAAVAVRAAGVDLLGVDQAGVEENADRLGSVELAGSRTIRLLAPRLIVCSIPNGVETRPAASLVGLTV